jgi:hypothetical protein
MTRSIRGLLEYLTVYSREPNAHSDGTALVNINNQAQAPSAVAEQFRGRTRQSNHYPVISRHRKHGHDKTGDDGLGDDKTGDDHGEGASRHHEWIAPVLSPQWIERTEFQQIYPDLAVGGDRLHAGPREHQHRQRDRAVLSAGNGYQQRAASGQLSAVESQQPRIDRLDRGCTGKGEHANPGVGGAITSRRAAFSSCGGHCRGRRVWTRLSSGEIHFRHQRRQRAGSSIDRISPVWVGRSARMSASG